MSAKLFQRYSHPIWTPGFSRQKSIPLLPQALTATDIISVSRNICWQWWHKNGVLPKVTQKEITWCSDGWLGQPAVLSISISNNSHLLRWYSVLLRYTHTSKWKREGRRLNLYVCVCVRLPFSSLLPHFHPSHNSIFHTHSPPNLVPRLIMSRALPPRTRHAFMTHTETNLPVILLLKI